MQIHYCLFLSSDDTTTSHTYTHTHKDRQQNRSDNELPSNYIYAHIFKPISEHHHLLSGKLIFINNREKKKYMENCCCCYCHQRDKSYYLKLCLYDTCREILCLVIGWEMKRDAVAYVCVYYT